MYKADGTNDDDDVPDVTRSSPWRRYTLATCRSPYIRNGALLISFERLPGPEITLYTDQHVPSYSWLKSSDCDTDAFIFRTRAVLYLFTAAAKRNVEHATRTEQPFFFFWNHFLQVAVTLAWTNRI